MTKSPGIPRYTLEQAELSVEPVMEREQKNVVAMANDTPTIEFVKLLMDSNLKMRLTNSFKLGRS